MDWSTETMGIRVRDLVVGFGDQIVLAVEDDGVGFDPDARAPGHWGLENMGERARAIGGTLAIDSRPGAGTRVAVHLRREAA